MTGFCKHHDVARARLILQERARRQPQAEQEHHQCGLAHRHFHPAGVFSLLVCTACEAVRCTGCISLHHKYKGHQGQRLLRVVAPSEEVLAPLWAWKHGSSDQVPVCNVLLCAPKGTGKSGFTNTLESAVQRQEIHSASVRPSQDHVTRRLFGYSLAPVCAKVWDLWGWRSDCLDDLRLVMEGRLSEGAEWSAGGKARLASSLKQDPTPADRMHCVALGLSYEQHNPALFPDAFSETRRILALLKGDFATVRVAVLLTQCDRAADVAADVANFHSSSAVARARTVVAKALDVDRDWVIPVTTVYGQGRPQAHPEMMDRCWSVCLEALATLLHRVNP